MTTTKTRITELLGIKYPIFQGGMAWIAEHTLCFRSFKRRRTWHNRRRLCTYRLPERSDKTDKGGCKRQAFGVNIMLMSPNADDLAQLVIDEGVPVVTTGAGNPRQYMAAGKEAGIKVIPVVPSVALAKRMERAGADAVIAEGTESGGHIGENTTMCLVPQVVDAVEIPVIAAGGIADGRGIAASFMLGAEGVQLGTRFLAAEECQINPVYKELVVKAKDTDSIVTGRYTGHPCRNVKTKFSKKLASGEANGTITPEEFEEITLGSLRKAVQDGNLEEGSFLCGAIAGMVKKVEPAKDMIEEMFTEAEKLLGK